MHNANLSDNNFVTKSLNEQADYFGDLLSLYLCSNLKYFLLDLLLFPSYNFS